MDLLQASGETTMKHYAGIDVSLEYSSVCVVDADGAIMREAKVLREPDALVVWFADSGLSLERMVWRPGLCRSGYMPL
jgi:hypothetical protein